MTNETPKPSPEAPAAARTTISEQQAREAMAAAFEVLSGAPSTRILELAGKIELAKALTRDLAAGVLVIGSRSQPVPAAVPVNRKARRSARHAKD